MAKTPSNMLPLGTSAPQFSLIDAITGKQVALTKSHDDMPTVIMFICNHCPYVKHVSHELSKLAKDYMPKKIRFYAINSNDVDSYPDDSPENMKKFAITEDFQFPYLFDETQDVAKAYHAACTPDFYVFDKDLNLAYRGQLDDSRPGNLLPVTGKDIRSALDNLLASKPIDSKQQPSLGCNIKWKK